MNSRINIEKEANSLVIIIKSYCDEKKQNLLMLWIILFSICGATIVSQFFGEYSSGTKVFFGVYIAFWLFFEFKVIYAYRWRKYGQEKIIVENDELYLIKTIGRRGLTQKILIEDIKKLDFYKDSNGDFAKAMNTSYWNINKYTVAIHLENEIIPFAIDLEQKDAKKIMNEIKKEIRKIN